jgi:glycerophosphoryl diester phosphodiesterase
MTTSQNSVPTYPDLRARKAAVAAAIVTAITLALVLNVNVSRVHAVGVFSALR